jgi:hypothetical protein
MSKKVLQLFVSQFDRDAKIRFFTRRSKRSLRARREPLLKFPDLCRMTRLIGCTAILSFFIISCTDNEPRTPREVNPNDIFFDYQVRSDESDSFVTVMLQYRYRNARGSTILLSPSTKVELDGEEIGPDSSKLTGAYYEIRKPARDFAGEHSIVFTDNDLKQYKQTFHFSRLALAGDPPDTIPKTRSGDSDWVFQLENVDNEEYIRVVLTDTARYHEGINRVDTVQDGRLVITAKQLQKFARGPVHLELIREEERKIKDGTARGGRIALEYSLRREYILQ